MASEQRLYTFSAETKEALKKFRLGTSRSNNVQAVIYKIEKSTLEISPESSPPEIYTSLADLSADLPSNTPRFILLSHPITLSSGRQSVPYVLLSYVPPTCNSELRMLYAGAKEVFRRESQVGRIVEVEDEEAVEGVEAVLKGDV